MKSLFGGLGGLFSCFNIAAKTNKNFLRQWLTIHFNFTSINENKPCNLHNELNKDQKLQFFIILLWSNKIRQLYKEPCKCGVDKVFFYWFYFWWLLHGLYKFIFSVKYLALTLIWWLSLFRYWTGAAELQNKPWPVRLETPCIYLLKVSITTSLQFSTKFWSDVIVLSLNRWISIDDLAKLVLIKTF